MIHFGHPDHRLLLLPRNPILTDRCYACARSVSEDGRSNVYEWLRRLLPRRWMCFISTDRWTHIASPSPINSPAEAIHFLLWCLWHHARRSRLTLPLCLLQFLGAPRLRFLAQYDPTYISSSAPSVPLILVSSCIKSEIYQFKMYCDICSKEVREKNCIYYCADCQYFAHVHCATSILPAE